MVDPSAGALELEKLVVKMVADSSQYEQVVSTFEARVQRTADHLVAMGNKMALSLSLPLGIVKGMAIKSFADFDKAMTESLAIMPGISAELRENMEDVAKSLSKKTINSAYELANSYYYLASAGLAVEQSIAALPEVQAFAQAGAFDLETATSLLMDSSIAFYKELGTEQEYIKKTSDALTLAGIQSNASVQQFAEAMSNDAAAAAASFGMELETLVSILGAYAATSKGAEAGSQMGRALRLTAAAWRENEQLFREHSIIVEEAGVYRNFIDILADMENAFKDLAPAERDALLEQLGFETLSQRAILPLLGLSKQMRKWEEEQRNAADTTKNVAAVQLQSFTNQMKITKNHVQGVLISVGEHLVPTMTRLGSATRMATEAWHALPSPIQSVVVHLGLFLATLGPTLVTTGLAIRYFTYLKNSLTMLIPILKTATVAVWAFTAPLLSAAAPFLAVAGAIAVVVGAVLGLIRLVAGKEAWDEAWGKAKDSTMAFVNKVIGFFKHFQENMKILWTWLSTNWKTLIENIAENWRTFPLAILHNIGVGIRAATNLFVAFVGWVSGQLLPTLWGHILNPKWIMKILEFCRSVYGAFQWAFVSVYNAFYAMYQGLNQVLFAFGMGVLRVMRQVGTSIALIMKSVITGDIRGAVEQAFTQIRDVAMIEMTNAALIAGRQFTLASNYIETQWTSMFSRLWVNFQQGAMDPNFLNTMNRIMGQMQQEMMNPFQGWLKGIGVPNFKFGQDMTIIGEKAAEDMRKATEKVNDTLKNNTLKVKLAGGIEGTDARSVDALIRVQEHALMFGKNRMPGKAVESVKPKGIDASLGENSNENTKLLSKIEQNTRPQNSPLAKLMPANLTGAS